jgi:putative transposase
VRSPEEYIWSSAGVHLLGERDRSGILDMAFREKAVGREVWAELHGREVEPERWNELRKCTYAGRPCGEESFVEQMEERFQRKWRRKVPKAARIAGNA